MLFSKLCREITAAAKRACRALQLAVRKLSLRGDNHDVHAWICFTLPHAHSWA